MVSADAEAWPVTEADIDPDVGHERLQRDFADALPVAELDADRRR